MFLWRWRSLETQVFREHGHSKAAVLDNRANGGHLAGNVRHQQTKGKR